MVSKGVALAIGRALAITGAELAGFAIIGEALAITTGAELAGSLVRLTTISSLCRALPPRRGAICSCAPAGMGGGGIWVTAVAGGFGDFEAEGAEPCLSPG